VRRTKSLAVAKAFVRQGIKLPGTPSAFGKLESDLYYFSFTFIHLSTDERLLESY
jgi:hypothetical protein